MSDKTIKDAIKDLPEKMQKEFLRAWKATKCMDIYGGHVEDYTQVIARHLEESDKRVKTLKRKIKEEIKKVKDLKKELVIIERVINDIF